MVVYYLLFIWAYYREESFTDWEHNLHDSLESILYEFRYLFLELAIMLNIAIWGYFYLKILTHRDIRYDEINAAIMYG